MTTCVINEIRDKFRALSRKEREKLLCALIRVNYGTAWSGDAEILRHFFPVSEHVHLRVDGLNAHIEALTQVAEEPTNPGYKVLVRGKAPKTLPDYRSLMRERAFSLFEITTDLPVDSLPVSKVQ